MCQLSVTVCPSDRPARQASRFADPLLPPSHPIPAPPDRTRARGLRGTGPGKQCTEPPDIPSISQGRPTFLNPPLACAYLGQRSTAVAPAGMFHGAPTLSMRLMAVSFMKWARSVSGEVVFAAALDILHTVVHIEGQFTQDFTPRSLSLVLAIFYFGLFFPQTIPTNGAQLKSKRIKNSKEKKNVKALHAARVIPVSRRRGSPVHFHR